jgi:hypothetical protein
MEIQEEMFSNVLATIWLLGALYCLGLLHGQQDLSRLPLDRRVAEWTTTLLAALAWPAFLIMGVFAWFLLFSGVLKDDTKKG